MKTYTLEFFSAPYDADFWKNLTADRAKGLAQRARQAGCVPAGEAKRHGVSVSWRGPDDLWTVALRLRGNTGPKSLYGARPCT